VKYRIEKIKIIGNAYMAVAGLPAPDHADRLARMGIEMFAARTRSRRCSGDLPHADRQPPPR
jgi:hypothetical protein